MVEAIVIIWVVITYKQIFNQLVHLNKSLLINKIIVIRKECLDKRIIVLESEINHLLLNNYMLVWMEIFLVVNPV
jgi:hypothetical protein